MRLPETKTSPPRLKPFQAYQPPWLVNKSSRVFKLQAFFMKSFKLLVVVLYTVNTSRLSAGEVHCLQCSDGENDAYITMMHLLQ